MATNPTKPASKKKKPNNVKKAGTVKRPGITKPGAYSALPYQPGISPGSVDVTGILPDSDLYNRLQTPGTIVARGGHSVQALLGARRELLRVLVVDDYRASADTMSRLVAAWGHDVQRAYDGNTGLALAAAYQPDVLLLDLIMSGVSGVALARQVQRQARVNKCLMIAVTGRTDAGHRLQCEEAGIDLFLVKPVDLSFLRTLLGVESEYRLRVRQDVGKQLFSTRLEQLTAPAYC